VAEQAFPTIDTQGARVWTRLEGGILKVMMTGSVESRDAGAIFDAYWMSLDEAVRREKVGLVDLDLSGVDFMNSSGILTLVRWMTRLRAEPTYRIEIRHDRNLTWQKTNIPVLAKLAPNAVSVSDN
jgi:hypothetical protein